MKHTPGPWHVSGDSIVALYERSDGRGSSNRWVATVSAGGGDQTRSEDWANARLIAAAPELLAALKDCVRQITALCSADDVPDSARAAIARVKS